MSATKVANTKMLAGGLILACIGLLGATVTGCMHTRAGDDTSVLCAVFEPLTFAKSDTKETKKLITVHNKTWEHYCD